MSGKLASMMSEAGPISVFMCDDSRALRTLVGLQMEDDPRLVMVGEAGDARECERAISEAAPDVILIDHGTVPPADPGAFVSQLRMSAPDAVLVLYSGRETGVLERDSQGWGADAFIHKGVSSTELARALTELVSRRSD